MNPQTKKPKTPSWMDLIGGILCILLGIFMWYIASQPVYHPEPGEEEAGKILR